MLFTLATRRTAEKKRHLTVGDGLLGQIVVDDDGVLSVVAEPLTRVLAYVHRIEFMLHDQLTSPMEVPVKGAMYLLFGLASRFRIGQSGRV